MNRLLVMVAVLEGLTGAALMTFPALVARLLVGDDVYGVGAVVGRVAGCALISLALACWPVRDSASSATRAVWAMLTYSLLVTCYLIFLGIGGQFVGVLLWPAVALHGLFALLLAREWFMIRQSRVRKG